MMFRVSIKSYVISHRQTCNLKVQIRLIYNENALYIVPGS